MRLETFTSAVGRVAVGTAAASLLVLGAAAFSATAAGAVPTQQIDLHNNTAGPADDCPAGGAAYWHFVLAPNNGSFAFVTISLNLGEATNATFTMPPGGTIVLNGSQTDNVFVPVPAGKTLTSLVTSGSFATYTGDGTPNQFNLSSVCQGTTPTTAPPTTPTTTPPTTPTTAPSTTAAPTTSVLGNSTVAPSNTQAAVAAAEVAGVQQLPYTGSNTTPLAVVGAGVLAGGAALAYAARRRQDA